MPAKKKTSPKLRVLVTAGPTREYVDPVRYLSNESSGRMGFAIAEALVKAGHEAVLVAGPCHLDTPKGVERIDVVSARDMLKACRAAFEDCDGIFMAAAVADWRPRRRLAGKWRAKDGGTETTSLDLVRNPDILQSLGRRKGQRLVIGFALETGDGVRRAQAKLERKRADFVVLNDETALNATRTSVQVIGKQGSIERFENRTKVAVARDLVRVMERAWQARKPV